MIGRWTLPHCHKCKYYCNTGENIFKCTENIVRYCAVCRPHAYRDSTLGASIGRRVAGYVVPVIIFSALLNIPRFLETELVSIMILAADIYSILVLSSAVQNVDKHLLSEMEYLISDWIVLLFHGVLFSKSQLNFLFDVRCVSIFNSNQRCPNCPPHSQYWDQETTAAPCLGTQSNTVH